eukprot:TRINITY_DN2218_c0_g1_i8.p1 TRINITY_DN2218_c0_g1~~TRINITY_DN2218_c0_g1_i8.p1  ORF type:complete len:257 (-),score=50.47 TRINITY_DN2218_c0_g1_i8:90-860(-)
MCIRDRSTWGFSLTASSSNFYNLPPVKAKRSAGFGYGSKYDFTKAAKDSPAPGTYDIKAEIDVARGKKIGKSFGASREQVSSSLTNPTKGKPGPGAYDVPTALSTISFSFRPKTNDIQSMTTNLKSPGPGAYDAYQTINPKGKHFVSKFKSSGATTINPSHSSRFKDFDLTKKNPGPGQYDQMQTIDKNGNYFVSKFKSSMCRSFSHATRKGLGMNAANSPGPGQYRLPSDFGYYQAKNFQDEGNRYAGKKKEGAQ